MVKNPLKQMLLSHYYDLKLNELNLFSLMMSSQEQDYLTTGARSHKSHRVSPPHLKIAAIGCFFFFKERSIPRVKPNSKQVIGPLQIEAELKARDARDLSSSSQKRKHLEHYYDIVSCINSVYRDQQSQLSTAPFTTTKKV